MLRRVAMLAARMLVAAVCVMGEGVPTDLTESAALEPEAGELSQSMLEAMVPAVSMQALDPATGSPGPPGGREGPRPLDPALDPALAVPALAPRPAEGAPPPQRRSLPPVPPPAPPGQMVLELMSKLRQDNDDYLEKGGGDGTRTTFHLHDVGSNRRMASSSSNARQSRSTLTKSISRVTESSSKVTESSSKVTESISKVTDSSSKVTESISKVTEDSSRVIGSSSRVTESNLSTLQSSSSSRTTQSSSLMSENSLSMSNSSRRMANTRDSVRRRTAAYEHHNQLLWDDAGGGAGAGSKSAAGGKGRPGGRARFRSEAKSGTRHPALVALLTPRRPRPARRTPRRGAAHRTGRRAHASSRPPRSPAHPPVQRKQSQQNKLPLAKNELKKLVRLLSENKQMMETMVPVMVQPGGHVRKGRKSRGDRRPRGRGVPRAGSNDHHVHQSSELAADYSSGSEQKPLHAAQLDLSPARGDTIANMRLKGRICQRNVVRVEGPKYNGRGRAYQEEFQKDKMGYSFDRTRLPKFIIPICCNCCVKSALGCE